MRGRVLRGVTAVTHPPTRAVVTVGVFDGVHRAHQQLIRSTVRLARRLAGTSVAVTFDPDPQTVLDPAHPQPILMPLQERLRHLQALGIDWVWIMPFTRRFSRTTAEQFIRRILIHRLRAVAVVVGEAFAFGRNRQGDLATLRRLGPSSRMRVVPVRLLKRAGSPISSSRIRRLIANGALAEAGRLLGRAPTLHGVVVRGTGRGRRLGVPTANIQLTSQVLPPRGVYAVGVRILTASWLQRGASPPRRLWTGVTLPLGGGVMNLGVRPTFGPGPLVCEVHLLGCSGRLLGRVVSVSLLARLRTERRFSSPQALVRQVRKDLRRARRLIARLS